MNLQKLLYNLSIFTLLFLTSNVAQAQSAATGHENSIISLNCTAKTILSNGRTNGSWLGRNCGVVVHFKNHSTNQEIAKFVSCTLIPSSNRPAQCRTSVDYKTLRIPVGFTAYMETVPEMPENYPSLGSWRGYAKPPLKSISSSMDSQGSTFRSIVVDHELVSNM